MIRLLKSRLARFRRDESGSPTVEFVLVFPLYLGLMALSVELGMVTLRHTLLERGLDMAVREVRLGTGSAPSHDQIKVLVCENAVMISSCESNLRLEMRPADIRVFTALDATVDCTDRSEESKPVREFTPGQQNQLMVLRACLKYDPLFPEGILGSALTKDVSGQAAIVSTTAFVQEPT
ncbi:TadE-like protein [Roseovarius azorensis]|uniref:TadE-like protein n=1 Tax=Roseovarius azorensis TaxID=1287727 RepID=A0A1H7TSV4_9RHOB|nr:TadE/TadG family type IV pilus assembly protein [Roseovarius azorensis]SEL87536.1 TadE-like protein [Roseovarius azorensis]